MGCQVAFSQSLVKPADFGGSQEYHYFFLSMRKCYRYI